MATLATIVPCRQAQLKDGRKLAFAEFGDAKGTPVFFFHGLPGTRLYRHPDDELTASLGVRLITIDRPGFGLSDFQAGRSLLDWPDVVELLANALQIDRFAVLGHAAGGPYAAACAYKLPQRVTKAAMAAGLLPMAPAAQRIKSAGPLGLLYGIAGRTPWLMKFGLRLFWRLHNFHCDQRGFIHKMLRSFPEPDRALFQKESGLVEMLAANIDELQHLEHADGYAEELCVLSRPWGFRFEDISVPLHLWWGEADNQVSPELAQSIVKNAPKASLEIVPGAGRMCVFSHWQQILAALVRHP
ncbi:MAG: alpha/beta hydrolase [bacterium]|nr:alpha/beta hydrolase [bacterium]